MSAPAEMPIRQRTPAEERALGLRHDPPVPSPEHGDDETVNRKDLPNNEAEPELSEVEAEKAEEAEEQSFAEKVEEEIDTIEPKGAAKEWTFTDSDGKELVYIQKPLTYFGKMQFYSILGNAADLALQSEGMSMSSILGARNFSAEEFMDGEAFMRALSRLVVFAPDVLADSFCIWLNVPRQDRAMVKEIMVESLSDEDAEEMMEVFIDQNLEAMTRFFIEQLPKLSKRAKSRFPSGVSLQSKRSKPTRPSIQSR